MINIVEVMEMRNIKLTIEYDGTNYSGWQRQNNALCIQEVIEKAIFELTGEKTEVIGSSRTDAGVHAKGFVANFYTESKIPDNRFMKAINSKLPCDIVIIDSQAAELKFHSRYNSKGKTYSYTILNREEKSALMRNYSYHFYHKLSIEAMKDGAAYLIGKHDFISFRNSGSSVKTTVRTIKAIDIVSKEEYVIFYVTADGFLYNMVRIIVGTLLDVGTGKITPYEVKDILESHDRRNAGRSVPGRGLCLEKVFY